MRSVLAVVLAVVGGAVTVQLVRWWPVYRNVAPYRRYWLRRAEEPGELRYVALGDSLTQGIGASRPERGYVGLIADALAQRTGRTVG
ncbi:MAG: SGNH/GDSL hydrolase family protein, partial [Actinomycetota bacterium]|nr:SGNH/GDSL hydrolase family protein [Actinomycetota bacterium]